MHETIEIPHSIQSMYPHFYIHLTTLLLGNANSPAASSSRLRVLSTNTKAPVVTETTMSTDLLQSLKILTKLGIDTVGKNLGIFAIDDIALTIEEPSGDLVLGRILNDCDDSLEFFGGELTSTEDR
jgi:hypothetical protein